MKKMTTRLVLAGVLLSTAVNAQQTLVPALANDYAMSGFDYATQAKSTAVQSRLVATAMFDYLNGTSYSLKDSTTLTYSGDRGHDSAMTVVKFDESLSQIVITNVLQDYSKITQTFDADNNILTRVLQFWNSTAGTWDNANNYIFTYDGNNNMLTSTMQTWNSTTSTWDNSFKEIYTYNTNNQVLTRITQQWDVVFLAWANSGRDIYEYNWNNDQTMHVSQYWDAVATDWVNLNKTFNAYVGTDLVTRLNQSWSTGTASWINSDKNVYTYDGDHHVMSDTYQYFSGGNFLNSFRKNYYYMGGYITTVVMQNWNAGTSSWDNDARELLTYDADHNVILRTTQDYNNGTSDFENDSRIHYTYNDFNQTTSIWGERWNTGIWQVTTTDVKDNYYYEEYGTSSVANAAVASDFNLYPVPAQNFVRIEKTWNTPQAFTVSITDMQGRLINSYGEKATANYSRNIDVAQLPAGNYVIKIATANGKASYQQFSVIH